MSAVASVARREILDGAGVVLELGPAPANILDRAAMTALGEELKTVAGQAGVKFVVLTGSGEHFSYGASVPEHLPGEVDAMLPEFHALIGQMNELPLPPLVAAVRGRCLGGGFELALACDVIIAAPDAQMGCPEVRLGVFPPAGAALLPLRVPAGRAAVMLQTGSLISGAEAATMGLVDLAVPEGDLLEGVGEWAKATLEPLSGAAVRYARRATRWPWRDACSRVLPELEQVYLKELMATEDAVEGLQAFLGKRNPEWKHR